MSPWRKAIVICLAFAAFRVAFSGWTQLAEDEAYYWEWSRSPALSYYDQGPMLALAIRAGTAVLGDTERGVRLLGVAAGAGASLLASAMVAGSLGCEAAAPWAALAFNGALLFAVGGVMMMHDTLMGFFWMLGLWSALKALRRPPWWLLAGAAVALGGLSKYTMVLLPACLVAGLLSRPSLRGQFRSPWLWAGALLAATGAWPILAWNAAHGWPSFQHVGSLAGADASRHSWWAWLEFLGSQAALLTPLLAWLVLKGWAAAWRGRRQGGDEAWMALACSTPVALFFLALSLRTRVEGNWAAPAYLGGLCLAGLALARSGGLGGRLSRWALGLAFGVTAVAYAQTVTPFLPLPAAYPKADVPARMDGWRELAQRVDRERASLGPRAFAAARTYQNAAELGFYLHDRPRVLIVQDSVINHQYRFWNDPAAHLGQDAILVAGQSWELGEMHTHFARYEALPDEPFVRNGVEVRRSHLERAWGFKG